MKDGTKQTVPTPTMRFTTCQTVCTDLKLDDEYTSLKHEHVLFLLHLVRHGGCQDNFEGENLRGSRRQDVSKTNARTAKARFFDVKLATDEMIYIYIFDHIHIWTSMFLVYMYLSYIYIYRYLSWLRSF